MRTVILPGMGADSRMYGHQAYRGLSTVEFVDWPPYAGEDSLRALAVRVVQVYGITEQCVVGGSSLGGMVACEVAGLVAVPRVILIGSARHPDLVNGLLERLSRVTAKAPLARVQTLVKRLGAGKKEVLEMFGDADPDFIKTMCRAIFRWQGMLSPLCPVGQIHGGKDKVIHPPATGVQIIAEGGHLIAMTHSELVARFIAEQITPS